MSGESTPIVEERDRTQPEEKSSQVDEKPREELSKRALKRLAKREKWMEYRPIKRKKEKERLKVRKQEAKMNNVSLGPSRKALKNYKMSTSDCKIRVCLDFSFDHLMADKELNKCVNQMARCYSFNRRSQHPLRFFVTNFKGISKTIIQKHNGYENWDVYYDDRHHLEAFKKEELVYLTSDSENVLQELKEEDVYIIGALVDHNSQKGLCLNIANEQGIRHGRLPIDEYLEMKTRKVLTIDQVFHILTNVACCKMSWKEAFLDVIPLRKGAIIKGDAQEGDTPEDNEDTTMDTAPGVMKYESDNSSGNEKTVRSE